MKTSQTYAGLHQTHQSYTKNIYKTITAGDWRRQIRARENRKGIGSRVINTTVPQHSIGANSCVQQDIREVVFRWTHEQKLFYKIEEDVTKNNCTWIVLADNSMLNHLTMVCVVCECDDAETVGHQYDGSVFHANLHYYSPNFAFATMPTCSLSEMMCPSWTSYTKVNTNICIGSMSCSVCSWYLLVLLICFRSPSGARRVVLFQNLNNK